MPNPTQLRTGTAESGNLAFCLLSLLFLLPGLLFFNQIHFVRYDLQGLIASLMLLCLVAAVTFRKAALCPAVPWTRWDHLLLLFLALLLLSAASGPDFLVSAEQVIGWIQGALLFFMVRLVLAERVHRTRFYWVVATSAGLFSIGFVLHMLGVIQAAPDTLFYPFTQNRNYLAQLLVLPLFAVIVLGASRPRRGAAVIVALCALAILAAIVLTRSRAVWLGLCVACAVLPVARGRGQAAATGNPRSRRRWENRYLLVLVATLLAVLAIVEFLSPRFGLTAPSQTLMTFLDPGAGSAGGRIRRWLNAMPMLADHPWLGVGPGLWVPEFFRYRHDVVPDPLGFPLPFNSYLALLGEAGIASLAVLLAWIAGRLFKGFRAGGESAIMAGAWLALVFAAFFHSSFSIRFLLLNFMLGAAIAAPVERDPPRPASAWRRPVMLVCLALACLTVVGQWKFVSAKFQYYLASHRYTAVPGDVRASLLGVLDPGNAYRHLAGASTSIAEIDHIDAMARLGTGRQHNVYLPLAAWAEQSGRADLALTWYARAKRRSPYDPALPRALCRLQRSDENLQAALDECTAALAFHSHDVDLHMRSADLQRQLGEEAGARRHWRQAARLASAQLQQQYVGAPGRRRRMRLVDSLELANLRLWESAQPGLAGAAAVLRTPLVHTQFALAGDALYYSSNESGRYELWRHDPLTGPVRLSNDRFTYFRPAHVPHLNRLYFASDNRGDGIYNIYHRDLVTGTVQRVSRDYRRAGAAHYVISPGQSQILFVREYGVTDVLMISDMDGRAARALSRDSSRKRDLAWSPDGARAAYIRNRNEVVVTDLRPGNASTVFTAAYRVRQPAFDPLAQRLAFVERAPDGEYRLRLHDFASGTTTTLVSSRGAIIAPLWLDRERLVFRQVVDDHYLLRRFDLLDQSLIPLGPEAGVVYGVQVCEADSGLVLSRASNALPLAFSRVPASGGGLIDLRRVTPAVPPLPVRRELLPGPGQGTPLYVADRVDTRAGAKQNEPGAALIWLHGGSASLSPRWNMYPQAFARAGIVFAGVNYESGLGALSSAPDRVRAVLAARQRLARRPDVDATRIFLVGVSSGSVLGRALVDRYPDLFAGLVEYAPAGDWRSLAMRPQTPPRLLVWGRNDAWFRRSGLRHTDLLTPDPSGRIKHLVLDGEGHDLRRIASIERRLLATLQFIANH